MATHLKEILDLRLVERSREELAYKLMRDMLDGGIVPFAHKPDKDQYLDLYAECLEAVVGDRKHPTKATARKRARSVA